MRFIVLATFFAAGFPGALAAHPDGAPWGSADPEAAENCASCHYDSEAVRDSSALTLTGVSGGVTANKIYEITLAFRNPDETETGFQAIASAGEFETAHNEHMEINGAQIRSTKTSKSQNGSVQWIINWRAPASISPGEEIIFLVAVNDSNHDESPFGDHIHYATFRRMGE
ncbi:MAG: choice-of-anchor V domain-containing protein [Pseudomonadota bacterium]